MNRLKLIWNILKDKSWFDKELKYSNEKAINIFVKNSWDETIHNLKSFIQKEVISKKDYPYICNKDKEEVCSVLICDKESFWLEGICDLNPKKFEKKNLLKVGANFAMNKMPFDIKEYVYKHVSKCLSEKLIEEGCIEWSVDDLQDGSFLLKANVNIFK